MPWSSAKPTLRWERFRNHLLLPLCHLANTETHSSKPTSNRKAFQATIPALESCCLQGWTCRNTRALWNQVPEGLCRQILKTSVGQEFLYSKRCYCP